jgi:tryptophan synthase alpha chain
LSDRGAGAIASRWDRLRAAGRPALIPYLTAGYPSADVTLETLRMLAEEGADFIEVGIPFSDPLADGPTIQHSSFEALRGGMTVGGVLALVRQARLDVPVVLFSYLNPILRYGVERFLADAREVGAAGLLLTDLPVGGDPVVESAISAGGLDRIPLVALTTAPSRLPAAVAGGSGFVYLISRLGVTGGRTTIGGDLRGAVDAVRAVTPLPVAVGFGIGTGAQAAAVAEFADGVVVGSALVRAMEDGIESARTLTGELRRALDAVAVAP